MWEKSDVWVKVTDTIVEFIRKTVEDANAKGVVIGMSGGIDSTTTAFLCVRALGKERVFGLIMPERGVTREEDVKDALEVCAILGIRHRLINIDPIVIAFLENLDSGSDMAIANLKPRIRMIVNYYYANTLNYLVAGTGNKSEVMTGYYTKYGDGGVDFLPIGDLYKTEVFELARYLGVPEKIIKKKPSAGLWVGQTDEGELGITYVKLDTILRALEKGYKPEEIPKRFDVSVEEVEKVVELVEKSKHKREMPPVVKLRDLLG
jgi:NAD+ synthase